MPVQENKQTNEEIQQERKTLDEKSKSVTDAIFDSLGLAVEEPKKEEPKEVEKQETQPEEVAEEVVEEQEETQEEVQEEVKAEEPEEEEKLVPQSKVQKRIDDVTREKKIAELKLQKLERENEELKKAQVKPQDADLEKLQTMTPEQLKAVKREVRIAQIEAKDDKTRLNQLLELEEKIDSVVINAPKNFEQSQLNEFKRAVIESSQDPDINLEKEGNAIREIASSIYSRSKALQGSVSGQAEAWQLAVDHFKSLGKTSNGKTQELERKVNNLKKKTGLETTVRKVTETKENLSDLKKKALRGDSIDKETYISKKLNLDEIIPKDFR